jgi:hypothetical protein
MKVYRFARIVCKTIISNSKSAGETQASGALFFLTSADDGGMKQP